MSLPTNNWHFYINIILSKSSGQVEQKYDDQRAFLCLDDELEDYRLKNDELKDYGLNKRL